MRSGLVKLLDRLCSLVDSQKPLEVGGEEDDALHRVTSLAWAAFQVLADHCVSWETQDSAVVSSGLAQQVWTREIWLIITFCVIRPIVQFESVPEWSNSIPDGPNSIPKLLLTDIV